MPRRVSNLVILSLLTVPSSCIPLSDWGPPQQSDPDLVRQRTPYDCGVAALASLLRLYGLEAEYDDLAVETVVERAGTSMHQLSVMALRHGVSTTGFKFTGLGGVVAYVDGDPWIALLGSGSSGHFVVVRSVLADTVFVLDPAAGSRSIKKTWFEGIWTGHALVVDRHARPVREGMLH